MKTVKLLFLVILSISLTGCLRHNYMYTPPPPMSKCLNTVVVEESKDKVWNKLVRGIGQEFFVINNMDKASGFINVSYAGDPEKFVNGGKLHHDVSNARGKRDYDFPAAAKQARYEAVDNGTLYRFRRELNLEGRANILLTEMDSTHTSITVNVRYIITKTVNVTDVLGKTYPPNVENFSFNTGESIKTDRGIEYYSTCKFEEMILQTVMKDGSIK